MQRAWTAQLTESAESVVISPAGGAFIGIALVEGNILVRK